MSPRTDDAPNQVTHSLEIEAALHFAVDHLAHQGGFASFLGSGTAS